VAIRAVSDGVGEDLPVDFNRVLTKQGDVSIPRILGEVLRSPQSLPALVRFGQQSRRAADALAKFLDNYLRILVQQLNQVETESPVAAT
jgi:predicted trehalose synthase